MNCIRKKINVVRFMQVEFAHGRECRKIIDRPTSIQTNVLTGHASSRRAQQRLFDDTTYCTVLYLLGIAGERLGQLGGGGLVLDAALPQKLVPSQSKVDVLENALVPDVVSPEKDHVWPEVNDGRFVATLSLGE
jgi:hypothetical protein